METRKCYRITADETAWSNTPGDGVKERQLFHSDVVELRETQLDASIRWPASAGTLYLLTSGSIVLAEGDVLRQGDLYWCNEHNVDFSVGAGGATIYCVKPLQNIGRELPSLQVVSADLPWQNFDDPAGRPTQPVQVLLEGSLSVLRTRFDPDYIAGEHWHDFDTLYFITDGRMQFGDEGWFEPGDIRAVHGGHSYGPERPGSDGVEFVLISLGGAVALHWSDLEPPP